MQRATRGGGGDACVLTPDGARSAWRRAARQRYDASIDGGAPGTLDIRCTMGRRLPVGDRRVVHASVCDALRGEERGGCGFARGRCHTPRRIRAATECCRWGSAPPRRWAGMLCWGAVRAAGRGRACAGGVDDVCTRRARAELRRTRARGVSARRGAPTAPARAETQRTSVTIRTPAVECGPAL